MEINEIAKLNRKTRSAFFGSLVLLGAFFVYNQIVSPHAMRLLALHRYASSMDNMLSKSKSIEGVVQSSKTKLEGMTVQFAQVRGTLYTQSEAEEFFSDLQAISVETDCPIYSLTFIPDDPPTEIKQTEQELGITAKKAVLSVAGVYENVIKLIERLQSRNRKVWVEGLNMEVINDDIAHVKCDITIKIYTIQNKEASLYE